MKNPFAIMALEEFIIDSPMLKLYSCSAFVLWGISKNPNFRRPTLFLSPCFVAPTDGQTNAFARNFEFLEMLFGKGEVSH